MIGKGIAFGLACVLTSPASAALFAQQPGDKLIKCILEKAADVDPNAKDISSGLKFAAFFPVRKQGDAFFRPGKEEVDILAAHMFDPAGLFAGSKINMFIDRDDKSGFVAGAVIASKPKMLILDPRQQKGGAYAAAVTAVNRMTLQPAGDIEMLGWCSISAGETARASFEALK